MWLLNYKYLNYKHQRIIRFKLRIIEVRAKKGTLAAHFKHSEALDYSVLPDEWLLFAFSFVLKGSQYSERIGLSCAAIRLKIFIHCSHFGLDGANIMHGHLGQRH